MLVQTHTCDFLDQLCDGCVVGQGASRRLHVGQLRHKLLYLHHRLGVVAFLQHTGDQQASPSRPRGPRPPPEHGPGTHGGAAALVTITGGDLAYLAAREYRRVCVCVLGNAPALVRWRRNKVTRREKGAAGPTSKAAEMILAFLLSAAPTALKFLSLISA